MAILIKSAAYDDGGVIPDKYSCFGANIQPDFAFSNPPKRAASYALILHDIDVALDGRTEDGSHWVVWNIPVSAGGIREGSLPRGCVVGRNVENRNAYLGPGAPPGERFHHYVLELYALDGVLSLPETAGRQELLDAMEDKVLDKAAYVGRFKRSPGMERRVA